MLRDLEEEGKLHFTKLQQESRSQKRCVFSQKGLWYWSTIAFALATIVAVFLIPASNGYELYVRLSLTLVFLLFLPGYALLKLILPTKISKTVTGLLQSQTSDENIVLIEKFALIVGLSIVLVPIFGLILIYTPFGLRLESIMLTLSLFTVGFATLAFYRESRHTFD